jgi:hypothetical protein
MLLERKPPISPFQPATENWNAVNFSIKLHLAREPRTPVDRGYRVFFLPETGSYGIQSHNHRKTTGWSAKQKTNDRGKKKKGETRGGAPELDAPPHPRPAVLALGRGLPSDGLPVRALDGVKVVGLFDGLDLVSALEGEGITSEDVRDVLN